MAEESFLLVSLEEEKSKKLAQVLSNDTSRKILDYLSKHDLQTETEISKEMNCPISTVHYNLSLLVEAGLISDENFNYSEKGKKVVHYSLSNKYVIIAPKNTAGLKEKLRQFLPVVLVAGALSLAIRMFYPVTFAASRTMAVPEAYDAAGAGVADSMMLKSASAPVQEAVASNQEFAIWFLAGSLVALLVYFVWAEVILKSKKKD